MASTTATAPAAGPARDSASPAAGQRQRPLVNGLRNRNSKPQPDKDSRAEGTNADAQSHDRIIFLLANCVGFPVILHTTSSHRYTGILSGASLDTPDARFTLKMARKTKDTTGPVKDGASDDEPYVGYSDDHVMDFARDDVVDIHVQGVVFDKQQTHKTNGASSGFRTDTDISGHRATRERELVAWQPTDAPAADISLSSNGNTRWDQFEVNERLYGVKTSYDEDMYTTAIDRSAPSYKERAAAAERKAREIEGAAGGSFQSREDANDANEEERFSGVQRDPQPLATSGNKYTLPARRAPTSQPTVPGAPVDPAIISSQLARPDSQSKQRPVSQAPEPKKENVPAESKAAEAPAKETQGRRDLTPSRPIPAAGPSKSPNATETVERDVLKSFKDFSAGERMRIQHQQRKQQQVDKAVRLNDLKKFSENFRLPRAVPEDMLGILAKDKKKQEEILRKTKEDAEAKKSPPKQAAVPDVSGSQKPAAASSSQAEAPVPAPIPAEPANQRGAGRGGRNNGAAPRAEKGSFPGSAGRGGQPGFGARKVREYAAGPPSPRHSIQTDLPVPRSSHGHTPSSATASRFNVTAHEFVPNATASTFVPGASTSATPSQTASRPVSKPRSPNKRSIFDGPRPKPASERKSFADGFNPIKRMRIEAEREGKTSELASTDGIPPSFTTRPTWETAKENEEKSFNDLFEKPPMQMQGIIAGNGMPHHHQLPLHVQQTGHFAGPQHNPRFAQTPMHPGQRDPYLEEQQRMHYSASHQGMYGSPRMNHGMVIQHSPMGSQAQPAYGMPQGPMFIPGQPMPMMNYNQRPGSMPPQMMGSPGMGMPQGMPMPQQGQHFMMPAQMYQQMPGQSFGAPGPQGGGNYPSPRPPPMMTQQGSQQGHGPTTMYQSSSQQGYYMQQGQPMNQMRGGFPMPQQGSFSHSPHMQYQHPMPGPRGPQQQQQQYGSYGQQPMHHPPPSAGSDMK